MKTWNKELKEKLIADAIERKESGLFKQGEWLQKETVKNGVFCGCMHGCMTQKDNNVLSESSNYMQWPLWLTHLSEKIFDGLSPDDCGDFVIDLMRAVPVSTDISVVQSDVEIARMIRLKDKFKDLSDIFDQVVEAWEILKSGDNSEARSVAEAAEELAESAEESARSAGRSVEEYARSAAESARSAARSAAWSARTVQTLLPVEESVWSAFWSVEQSVWSAAESAEESARSAAWSARSVQTLLPAWSVEAKELIRILSVY